MKARMQERGDGARNEMNEKNGTVRKTAGAERKKGGVLRRMLTVLLAAAMLFSLSGLSALAEDDSLEKLLQKGEMVLAHCTLPMNMPESYRLSTHYESGIGVAVAGHVHAVAVDPQRVVLADHLGAALLAGGAVADVGGVGGRGQVLLVLRAESSRSMHSGVRSAPSTSAPEEWVSYCWKELQKPCPSVTRMLPS